MSFQNFICDVPLDFDLSRFWLRHFWLLLPLVLVLNIEPKLELKDSSKLFLQISSLKIKLPMLSSSNLLLLVELLTIVTIPPQLSKGDDYKINVLTPSLKLICTYVNCAIIVLNSLIWLVTKLPLPILRLTIYEST